MPPNTYYRLFHVLVYNNLGEQFFELEMATEANYTCSKLSTNCDCYNDGVHDHFLVMMDDHAYEDDTCKKGSEYFEDLLLVGYFIDNKRDNDLYPIKNFDVYFNEALHGSYPKDPTIRGGEKMAISDFLSTERWSPSRQYFQCTELTTAQSIYSTYIDGTFMRLILVLEH